MPWKVASNQHCGFCYNFILFPNDFSLFLRFLASLRDFNNSLSLASFKRMKWTTLVFRVANSQISEFFFIMRLEKCQVFCFPSRVSKGNFGDKKAVFCLSSIDRWSLFFQWIPEQTGFALFRKRLLKFCVLSFLRVYSFSWDRLYFFTFLALNWFLKILSNWKPFVFFYCQNLLYKSLS